MGVTLEQLILNSEPDRTLDIVGQIKRDNRIDGYLIIRDIYRIKESLELARNAYSIHEALKIIYTGLFVVTKQEMMNMIGNDLVKGFKTRGNKIYINKHRVYKNMSDIPVYNIEHSIHNIFYKLPGAVRLEKGVKENIVGHKYRKVNKWGESSNTCLINIVTDNKLNVVEIDFGNGLQELLMMDTSHWNYVVNSRILTAMRRCIDTLDLSFFSSRMTQCIYDYLYGRSKSIEIKRVVVSNKAVQGNEHQIADGLKVQGRVETGDILGYMVQNKCKEAITIGGITLATNEIGIVTEAELAKFVIGSQDMLIRGGRLNDHKSEALQTREGLILAEPHIRIVRGGDIGTGIKCSNGYVKILG